MINHGKCGQYQGEGHGTKILVTCGCIILMKCCEDFMMFISVVVISLRYYVVVHKEGNIGGSQTQQHRKNILALYRNKDGPVR